MQRIFSLALDGPAGAGKSTIARAVAQKTGALYLDTGAMYRAVGLWMKNHGIDPLDLSAVSAKIGEVSIDIRHVGGVQRVFLDDEDVSEAIRSPEISMAASAVSAAPAVRARLVAMQQEIARGRSVVMDGRDIGTAVLPEATLKIFLTADVAVRAKRRFAELCEKGRPESYECVLEDMALRDFNDSTRAASPLLRAADAIEIDSGALSLSDTVKRVLDLLFERLAKQE